jgi:DNA processing protein
MSGTESLSGLADAVAAITARGTDPLHLAAVLAWSVRPRRSADALRRQVRDQLDVMAPVTGGTSATGAPASAGPAARLAAVARDGVRSDDIDASRALVERWRSLGCRIALVGDPGYPVRLAAGWPDVDVPVWLIRRGTDAGSMPSVAIVGTRRPTTYGTGVAAWLAESVARIGIRVVSGGAVGIDAAAHRAALGTPGGTTVVLGCGHGVAYPRPHARTGGLFEQILDDDGELVGELFPEQPARPMAVRARNRIVAGLADAVVVVEGGERSGSLLTADAAAGLGRAVLAVPGDVRAPGSLAPHRLLREGATPCTEPADLLAAIQGIHVAASGEPSAASSASGGSSAASAAPGSAGATGSAAAAASRDERCGQPAAGDVPSPVSALPPAAVAVLQAAWPRAVSLEDLAGRSSVPVGALLAAVTRARLAGELAEDASGVRLRRAPAATRGRPTTPGHDGHTNNNT